MTIIIDTPPVLSVGDAIGLIDLVDYTILVTETNISKMEELRVSIDLVEQRSEDHKVDAIIINDFIKSSFYYGYDYYSYKYSGNYDYTQNKINLLTKFIIILFSFRLCGGAWNVPSTSSKRCQEC